MSRAVYLDFQGNEIEPSKADPVPMTNADRIRQMTDEELAQLFMDCYGYAPWCDTDSESWCEMESCMPCCEKWLKAPVEEVDE